MRRFFAGFLLFCLFLNSILWSTTSFASVNEENTEKNIKTENIKSHSRKWKDELYNWLLIKYKDKNFLKNNQSKNLVNKSLLSSEYLGTEDFSKLWISLVKLSNEKAKDWKNIKSKLEKSKDIEIVEPDYPRFMTVFPWVNTNDSYASGAWHLTSIWAPDVWEMYNDTEDKTLVSVSDTWFDYNHQDLIWNLKDLSSCMDDSWNSYTGWCVNAWLNFDAELILPENDPYDSDWHGTHVAWIIWSESNNWTGTLWVTQNVEMMIGKIMGYDTTYNYNALSVSSVIRALNFAIQNSAKVVNMSYGGPSYSVIEYSSINDAKSAWILVVISAWNNGRDNDVVQHFYPSDYDLDNIISVASLSTNDNLSFFSNFWSWSVDVAAPGWDLSDGGGIYSTYPYKETLLDISSFSLSWSTISWTWSGWWIDFLWGLWTTESYYYGTWISSTIEFPNTFNFTWFDYAELQWNVSCDFWTWSNDDDFQDYLNIYIKDVDTSTPYLIGQMYHDYVWGFYWNFTFPITNPSLLSSDNNILWMNFETDWDDDVWMGCLFSQISIVWNDKDRHDYVELQWTSMAAPVVTWIAASIWSYKPDLTYSEVKDIIMTSVDNLWLQNKLVTWGKANNKNAILELIKRYGISKSWLYDENVVAKNIDLDNKIITLSGSILDITGTWEIIKIFTGSQLQWTWTILIGTGTSIKNNTWTLFSVSNDFNLSFKDTFWSGVLDWVNQNFYWDTVTVSYIWNLTGSWIYLKLWNYYDGPFSQNLEIPLNSDIVNENVTVNLYIPWNQLSQVSDSINIEFFNNTLPNVNFDHIPWYFEVIPSSTTVEVWELFNIQVSPKNWSWSTLTSYTWTVYLTQSWNLVLDWDILTWNYAFQPWDFWVKSFTWIMFTQSGSFSIDFKDLDNNSFSWSSVFITVLTPSIPVWFLTFSSWAYTNTPSTNIEIISSEYPVDYTITWDISASLTGTLVSSWSISLILSSWDGPKNISINLVDSNLNNSNIFWGIYLDTTPPLLNITSHIDYQKLTDDSIIFTWNMSDFNWINSLKVNGNNYLLWSDIISLSWGLNTFNFFIDDILWNSWTQLIHIIRVPEIIYVEQKNFATWVTLSFETDINAGYNIYYSTGSNMINSTILSNTWVLNQIHMVDILWLVEWEKYYYTVNWNINGYTGALSSVKSFVFPKQYDFSSSCPSNTNQTWSIVFTGTWYTSNGYYSTCSGSVNIYSANDKSTINFSLDNLEIISNSWDWNISAPEQMTFSGTFTSTWYVHNANLSYIIGNSDSSITLSGWLATVSLDLWSVNNGKVFSIFKSSDNGLNYSLLTACLVNNGICEFVTSGFSLFTLAEPLDTTPNTIAFTSISNAELNTTYISNTWSVQWITDYVDVTITGGEYSINGWTFMTWSSIVWNNDIIQVRLISSALNSTAKTATIGIWNSLFTYTITTKATTTWGGGGGWSSWVSSVLIPICTSVDLVCTINNTGATYTLKTWVTCLAGNLGKKCEQISVISEEKLSLVSDLSQDTIVYESTSDIIKNIVMTNKLLMKNIILTTWIVKKNEESYKKLSYLWWNIKKKFEIYLNEFALYIEENNKLEKSLINKDTESIKTWMLKIAILEKKMKENISFETYWVLKEKILQWEKIYYIEYDNKWLKKLQYKMNNLSVKKWSKLLFETSNKIMNNLSILLLDKKITKEERIDVIKKTKNLYKFYKLQVLK